MEPAEMARLATIPAMELLAETRSALLLVDVQTGLSSVRTRDRPHPRRASSSQPAPC